MSLGIKKLDTKQSIDAKKDINNKNMCNLPIAATSLRSC